MKHIFNIVNFSTKLVCFFSKKNFETIILILQFIFEFIKNKFYRKLHAF